MILVFRTMNLAYVPFRYRLHLMNLLRIACVFVLGLVLIGCPAQPSEETEPKVEQKPLVVFLVRHAEKVITEDKDPELSEAGKERSDQLAATLKSSKIEHIHSSDVKRTRNTAKPVAEALEKEVKIYDPRKLKEFAESLKKEGGRHLVVGHSNTTPQLTELLGGEPGGEIEEKSEYDRLYMVTIGKDGTVSSALLRYGDAYEKSAEDSKTKAAGSSK